MTARTYNELFEPPTILTLTPIPGGYMVTDQHGRPYTLGPFSLTAALRFMKAMADRGDAVLDDASVEQATWHSVRVPDSNVIPLRKGA